MKAIANLARQDAGAVGSDLETIQGVGITSVAQLVEAVTDTSRAPSIRMIACSMLALLDERGGTTALTHALETDEDDGVAWEAAKAPARLRAQDAAPTLVRVLKHGNATRQSAAAWVLGWLGVPNTIAALRAAALNPHLDVHVGCLRPWSDRRSRKSSRARRDGVKG